MQTEKSASVDVGIKEEEWNGECSSRYVDGTSGDSIDGKRRKSLLEIMQQPRLSRCFATSIGACVMRNTDLRDLIINAYSRLPFHGPSLHLADGVLLTADSWRCALEMVLDTYESRDALSDFDLESWLSHKVMTDGSEKQKQEFTFFLRELDQYLAPSQEPVESLAYVSQPLNEIEVYRDLGRISFAVESMKDEAVLDDEDHQLVLSEEDD